MSEEKEEGVAIRIDSYKRIGEGFRELISQPCMQAQGKGQERLKLLMQKAQRMWVSELMIGMNVWESLCSLLLRPAGVTVP